MAEKKKDEVLQKLDDVMRLLALLVTKGENQRNSIRILNGAGFKPSQIGRLLGLDTSNVTANLAQIKKMKKKKKDQ